jgi:F-type H+-transporting ATPase subunit b
MKARVAAGLFLSLAIFPSLASAAEEAEKVGSWLTLVYYAINFAAFVLIIFRFGGPAIRSFFHDRAKNIRRELDESSAALKRAEQTAAEAAEKTSRLEAAVAALAAQMQEETRRESQRIRENARISAQRIKRDAELTAAAVADAAQRQLRARLATAATRRARELIAASFDQSDQSRLVAEFMERLGSEGRS